MNANVESSEGNTFDKIKWGLAFAVLAAVVAGNSVFGEMSVLIRAVAFVVAVAIALLLASLTEKGRTFLAFAKESRTEVRKVVWPNRQEATHTTMIIGAVTAVMALLMWGLDALLLSGVGFLTGLRF